MFPKLLIANRGEIACRVIRTAKRLGMGTVAVYSEADSGALHTGLADEAYYIGGARPEESYLNARMILEVAEQSGALAIHPGYGFLSEDADFAAACADRGFVFVGPDADAIRAMGSKTAAKSAMEQAGVPVVPGYHGADQDASTLAEEADRIGYPVLIKASAGGGGRGMRLVTEAAAMEEATASARREAHSAFGDGGLLLEKYLAAARHVEVQVLADRHGNTVHLHDRDCSVQRRHQKVIEEAPAPGLSSSLRRAMGAAAVTAARAVKYVGAGTIEFLLDEDASFYFMEMNTRLQVEHPVTEMITGLDLVEWQLRVAAGQHLTFRQEDVKRDGHAFEARLYAEDPARDFLPSAGVLRALRFPDEGPALRVDTGVRQGSRVGVHYDPMIAKVIVHGTDRGQALARLRTALARTEAAGPATNADFLGLVAGHPAFANAVLSTCFVDDHRADLIPAPAPVPERILALACLAVLEKGKTADGARPGPDPHSPWGGVSAWRMGGCTHRLVAFGDGIPPVKAHPRDRGYLLELPSGPLVADGELSEAGDLGAELDGRSIEAVVSRHGGGLTIMCEGSCYRLAPVEPGAGTDEGETVSGTLTAPMPGRVIAVEVTAGATVHHGATLVVLEAMKMEHAVFAPADGAVTGVHCSAGDQVDEGAALITFDADGG